MALEMKSQCQKCHTVLAQTGTAYICSYECTFCDGCATAMDKVCPNCQGILVIRPTRAD
jgi:hypothetical protein